MSTMSGEFPGYIEDLLRQMKNMSEEGQPRYENPPHADGLDRNSVVAAHEAFRTGWMSQIQSTNLVSASASLWVESPTASAPLSKLKVITLPQLKVGKRHKGRVLHGLLCVKPFKMSGIVTVLEDECGRAVRLTIYNVLSGTASGKVVEDRFPIGMRVIVKEPFFKFCTDGKTAIRVDNPADIALDESWKEQMDRSPSPQCSCDDIKFVEELEVIRSEGNELFSAQNWIGAVSKYSLCINTAVSETATHKRNKFTSSKLDKVIQLAYSNRAEARLRLRAFKDAINDADKALEFDSKHVKSLVRKGRAAHSLGLYEKSITSFKAALDQAPEEESILSILKASTIAYEQSRTGNYDLVDFYARNCTGDIPSCADFIGPVEIRRVYNGGYGGRGLFSTKKVEPGQVLLVSNPLAIFRQKSDARISTFDLHKTQNSGIPQDLIAELANRIMKSKREMAQLYSLASYGKREMEIPSMDLLRPGSEWMPPGAEKLEVDMRLIGDIAQMNVFGFDSNNGIELVNQRGNGEYFPRDGSCGLWLTPSFANHSCAPNCWPAFIGDAMFVRAAKDIAEGEELTIPYVIEVLNETLGTRQDASRIWFFTCKCERCLIEESLMPRLAKIAKALPKLMKAVSSDNREGGGRERRAVEELTKVADQVEAVIQSCDPKLKPEQQSWLRAAFHALYLARFDLAAGKDDSEARMIGSLQLAVDSMASVSVGPNVLNLAAILLRKVEQRYSKHSHSYGVTLDRVLGFYKIAYGKQPNSVMQKLIRARSGPREL